MELLMMIITSKFSLLFFFYQHHHFLSISFSLRKLPGSNAVEEDLSKWITSINDFFSSQLEDYILHINDYIHYIRYIKNHLKITNDNADQFEQIKKIFWDNESKFIDDYLDLFSQHSNYSFSLFYLLFYYPFLFSR